MAPAREGKNMLSGSGTSIQLPAPNLPSSLVLELNLHVTRGHLQLGLAMGGGQSQEWGQHLGLFSPLASLSVYSAPHFSGSQSLPHTASVVRGKGRPLKNSLSVCPLHKSKAMQRSKCCLSIKQPRKQWLTLPWKQCFSLLERGSK